SSSARRSPRRRGPSRDNRAANGGCRGVSNPGRHEQGAVRQLEEIGIELAATRRVRAERGIVVTAEELKRAPADPGQVVDRELALRPEQAAEVAALGRLVKNIDELVEETKWPSPGAARGASRYDWRPGACASPM